MEEHAQLAEPGSTGNEAEVATGITGLRILARIIARDLTNSQRGADRDNVAAGNKPENRLTNDKGLR